MFISSGLFLIAIQSVNMISRGHAYQEKEPKALKKIRKILIFHNMNLFLII